MIITYSGDDQYKIIGFNTLADWFVKEPFLAAPAIRSVIIPHEGRGMRVSYEGREMIILYEDRNVVM